MLSVVKKPFIMGVIMLNDVMLSVIMCYYAECLAPPVYDKTNVSLQIHNSKT
jgi:hypothetical protein